MSTRPFPYTVPTSLPADPVLREFYPEFVERWLADLRTTWPGIVERGDAEELYRFGHTIKGSFLQFGLKELAGIGIEIMQASKDNDWTSAEFLVEGLEKIMTELHLQLGSTASGTSS